MFSIFYHKNHLNENEMWFTISFAFESLIDIVIDDVDKFLIDNGFLIKNKPHQCFEDIGFFKIMYVREYIESLGSSKFLPQLFISTKGVEYINQLLRKNYYNDK